MARAALAAEKKLASGDKSFLEAKIATARFYGDHVLVQASALRDTVVKGAPAVMALSEEPFPRGMKPAPRVLFFSCSGERCPRAGYPTRPVVMIVPFGGRRTDRHGGARGRAGDEQAAEDSDRRERRRGRHPRPTRRRRLKPDGYTILIHHIGMATTPSLYRKLRYNPLNDFDYIGLVNEVPMTLIAKPGFPAKISGVPLLHQGEQGQGHLRQCRHRRGLAPVRHAVHERDRPISSPSRTRAPARR